MKVLLVLVALTLGFAGATLWKANRQEMRAEATYPPLGQMIDVNGTAVHYLQMGSGPDIVLIHGASGNLRDFSFDLMQRLAPHYRVTAFDRPGLGYTDRLDGNGASIFEQADLLVDAAAQIGVERPLVLGHSYGGAVGLAWATRHPERTAGLILLAAASNPWETPLSTYYRVLSHPLAGSVTIPMLSAWVPDRVVTDTIAQVFAPQTTPEGYDAYVGAGLTLRRSSLRENALQRASLLAEVTQMTRAYPAIDMPVEILHGTEDTTVWLSIHSEPLAEIIPGANLVRMEGVGHSPHHAEPQTVLDAVDRAASRAGLR